MKSILNVLTILSICAIVTPSFAQNEKVIPYAEHYEGGRDSLLADIQKSMIYPSGAKRNRIQGTVLVHVSMDENTEYKEVKIIKRLGSGCDQEAIRIVKELRNSGKLRAPGYKANYTIPVKFKL